MLHRRTFLWSLASLATATIALPAAAGHRKRARCPQPAPCSCQNQEETQQGAIPKGNLICVMYPWANHGTYCSYYAVPCVNGVQQTPVNYDGNCGLPPGSPCNSASCMPRSRKETISIPDKVDLVADGLKGGFKDPLAPIGFAASKVIKIELQGGKMGFVKFTNTVAEHPNVVTFKDKGNKPIFVQLFKVTVHPEAVNGTDPKDIANLTDQTFWIGHQVDESPKPEAATKAEPVKVESADSRIYLVTQKDERTPFTVILHE